MARKRRNKNGGGNTALTQQKGALRPLRLCFLATDAGRSGAEFPSFSSALTCTGLAITPLASGSDGRMSIQRKEPPLQLNKKKPQVAQEKLRRSKEREVEAKEEEDIPLKRQTTSPYITQHSVEALQTTRKARAHGHGMN
jgi:hypothetical protein